LKTILRSLVTCLRCAVWDTGSWRIPKRSSAARAKRSPQNASSKNPHDDSFFLDRDNFCMSRGFDSNEARQLPG
jgi:hypothetical protein